MKKDLAIGYTLALFLGGIGAHLFYYGKYIRATLYLIFSWTLIPIVLGWIDMFFIKKWTDRSNTIDAGITNENTNNIREYDHSEIDYSQSAEKKNVTTLSKNASTPTEPPQEKSIIQSSVQGNQNKKSSFYEEKEIILPEYSHLETKQEIIARVRKKLNVEKKSSKRTQLSLETYVSHGAEQFGRDSWRYRNRSEEKVDEIPFDSYWPTFENLTDKQKEWYFYWRKCVLNKQYIDVDLSYIFIFVYELINYTFNKSAAFNVSMLVRLLNNYSERYPKLYMYLNDWIADMFYELGEFELAKKWDNRQIEFPKLYSEIENKENDLNKIHMNVWKPYIRNYMETEFLKQHREEIYKAFKESIPLLEEKYREQASSLLDNWFTVKNSREIRQLFSSAVIVREESEVHIPFASCEVNQKAYDDISNLFRLAENVTRKQKGEYKNINVDNGVLPQNMKESVKNINSRFKVVQEKEESNFGEIIPPKPNTPTQVNVNAQEITWEMIKNKEEELTRMKAQFKQSSDAALDRSETSTEKSTEAILDAEAREDPVSLDWEVIKQKEYELSNFESTLDDTDYESDTDKHLFTSPKENTRNDFQSDSLKTMFEDEKGLEQEDVQQFINALSLDEKDFLLIFNDLSLSKDHASSFAKGKGQMLGVFLDAINEKSYELLDEVLVEEYDNEIKILGDFQTILEKVRRERYEH
ncbi:NINE protein [Halobacillus fulvus]|nr:NINE protein [Halobacillus fulvus]